MKPGIKKELGILFVLFILSYPLFYYAYKFGSPDFGNRDFYSYYKLYKNWDFAHVESPFNSRLISTFFIYLFNHIGFFYDTKINYHHEGIDQQVFFNAVLFNYISLVLTCYVIYRTINKFFSNDIFALGIGFIYLFGFGTMFYSLNTLTESFSILLFACVVHAYLSKSYWILPLFLLAVVQREYIFFIMGLVSLVHYFSEKENRKYLTIVFFSSIAFFVLYYVLRKTFFFTPEYSAQLEMSNVFSKLFHPAFPLMEYFRQSFLNQNIFILYIIILAYKYMNKLKIDKVNLLIMTGLYLQVNFISFVTELGNSCGRYFYLSMPLLLFFLAKELRPLFLKELK